LLRSKEGSQQLEHVSVAVQSITESAGKVKLLVDEVSQGSQEQARGMDQIAKAVAEMDRVTQATAANAEESASAGAEMTAQAQALRSLVISLRQMVHGDTASHEDVRQLERV
jgi:methyl-accepting chemotaxis protein